MSFIWYVWESQQKKKKHGKNLLCDLPEFYDS